MSKFLFTFLGFLMSLTFDIDRTEVINGARAKVVANVHTSYIGLALTSLTNKKSVIKLGYSKAKKKFAFIVADSKVDPATVEADLPEGYLEVSGIDATGMPFATVSGDLAEIMSDKDFLTGVQAILASGYADGGVTFRHNKTEANDNVVIQITFGVDYKAMTSTEIAENVVDLRTGDGKQIRFMENVNGYRYSVTGDGLYIGDQTVNALSCNEIRVNGGLMMATSIDTIEFPQDAEPVTFDLVDTEIGNWMLIGFDDGTNITVKVDDTGKVVSHNVSKTEYGAILAIHLVNGTPTAIVDDGNDMQRMPLTVIDPALSTMLGHGKKTTTPNIRA